MQQQQLEAVEQHETCRPAMGMIRVQQPSCKLQVATIWPESSKLSLSGTGREKKCPNLSPQAKGTPVSLESMI